MSFDPSNDWKVMDGLETITYTSKRTSATFSVPNACRGKITKGQVEGRHFLDVGLAGSDTVFNVWVNQLPADYNPIVSDTFVDSLGTTWIVVGIDLCTLGTRWRLHSRKAH